MAKELISVEIEVDEATGDAKWRVVAALPMSKLANEVMSRLFVCACTWGETIQATQTTTIDGKVVGKVDLLEKRNATH
jgi:hypothetical protein